MKLASYRTAAGVVPVLLREDRVYPFAALDPRLPTTLIDLFRGGEDAMTALRIAAERSNTGKPLDLKRLAAPLFRPGKFMGIGMNYMDHVDELRRKGDPVPDISNQTWFNKQTTSIVGPYDPVHLPSVSEQLDFEGELAVVIGRRCRHVASGDASKVIAGYMVTNDVSVRDWQRKSPTATLGKSFDTHGPTGPWITTADQVPDPEALAIRTTVDGLVMQDGNTAQMIHGIAAQIAYLSQVVTLEPGDIIATGTPHGVAVGRTPPPWLRAGQSVRVEIDGLGYIENRVIAEPLEETTFIQ
jgi:2-keto-4-pentenoate hydratase/2-oxohepta-3-ene-1,7-dioic acid hydratase in catechol pathway